MPIAGEYSGQLNNAGERIELINGRGETLSSFTYGTRSPWPEAPDGSGPSLELIDPAGDPNLPTNWRASLANNGSPGRANPSARLALAVVVLEGGRLRLEFEGKAGFGYTAYVRDTLSAGTWQVLERGEPVSRNQPIELTIDIPTNTFARFFQVSIP